MSDDMDSGMFAQLQCALEEKKLEIKELQAIIDKLKEEQRTDTKNSEIFKLSEKVLRKMSIKGLTDAFITLFEEADWCSNNKTNSKGIEFFLEKYRSTAELIKNQRLSSKNFEIIQKIGQGTFSDIFLAKLIDDSGEKPYVIKRIQKSQTFSESSYVWPTVELDVFVLASRLDSPGIAVLDSAFQDPYYLYFALDFYIGGDLLGLLERKEQFSESWALFYFAEMAIGVNTLHGLGYIHRDIKAQNFLLHSSGHVVLTGFGSACRMTNRKSDQAIYVTTEYMSPELVRMLRGEHVVYGPSVDWWSLGVILYEMLVGSTPFSGEEVNAFTLTYRITNHKTEFSFPPGACVSEATQQLIKGLIEEEQARMNFEDIKNHEVFKKVDWQSAVENLRDLSTTKSSGLNVPFKPEFVGAFDTTFFDEYEKEDLCAYISEYRHEYHFGNFLPYMEFYYQRTAKTTGSPAAKKQKPAASSAKLSKISSGNVGVQHKEKKEKEIVERSREMEPFVRTNKNRRVNFDHETLFFEYVKQNDIDNVKLMVERGMASVDAQTKSFSQSPLHIACMFNAYEVAVFLVEQGAPLNQQDDFLCTPLHLALDAGSKKLSLYLLACGADVTIPDGENLKVTEKTQDPEILDAIERLMK